MYNEYYNFGGLTLRLTGETPWEPAKVCAPFRIEPGPAEHTIHIALCDAVPAPPPDAIRHACTARWRADGCAYIHSRYDDRYAAFAVTEGSHTHVRLTRAYAAHLSARTILESAGVFDILAAHAMLVLHSSYIITAQGSALLFSGPSGIGKSTQAALWCDHAGAHIVNGDRTLVRVDHATANGIFYAGTSGISHNETAPLRAIVLLGQAAENRIRRPRPQQAFAGVLHQCAYYEWDAASAVRMTELAAQLVSRVPVLCFDCRCDASAVRALQAYLEEEKNGI